MIPGNIECQHSNSLATVTAAILVHNENLLRLCTKMASVSMAKDACKCSIPVVTETKVSLPGSDIYYAFFEVQVRTDS